jgi:hypothetical protein
MINRYSIGFKYPWQQGPLIAVQDIDPGAFCGTGKRRRQVQGARVKLGKVGILCLNPRERASQYHPD